MTKEQIIEAYTIAERYFLESKIYTTYHDEFSKDIIQIGMQIALNGEVLYNEDGTVKRIE